MLCFGLGTLLLLLVASNNSEAQRILCVLNGSSLLTCQLSSSSSQLELHPVDLQSYHRLLEKSRDYLCRELQPCTLGAYFALYGSLMNAIKGKLADVEERLKIGTRLLFRELRHIAIDRSRLKYTEEYGRIDEELLLSEMRWKRDISLTIVISHDETCLDLACLEAHYLRLSHAIIPAICSDLDDFLRYAGALRIAYGFAGSPLTVSRMPALCDMMRAEIDQGGDAHRRWMLSMESMYCQGFDVTSLSAEHEDFRFFDVREMLASASHAIQPTDYYILLDSNVAANSPSWLAGSLLHLLEEAIIGPGLGVSLLGCARVQELTQSRSIGSTYARVDGDGGVDYDPSTLLEYPLNPVLHRSHFDLLVNGTFLNPVHVSLNNFLLMDTYRSLQSVFCADYAASIEDNDDQLSLLLHHSAWLERYVEHLPKVRKGFLMAVNDNLYAGNPIAWKEEQLGLQAGDVLHSHYCHNWIGEETGTVCSNHDILDGSAAALCSNLHYQERIVVSKDDTVKMLGLEDMDKTSQPGSSALRSWVLSTLHKEAVIIQPISLHQSPSPVPVAHGSRVAVITAVYGSYEGSCKPFSRQTVSTDFYCFTDNEAIGNRNRGWIVDTIPYHLMLLAMERKLNLSHHVNSLHSNQHPFNVAKFYKLYFSSIPCLQAYDVVIWVDGTVRVVDPFMVDKVLQTMNSKGVDASIMVFEHEYRGKLSLELEASHKVGKYTVTNFAGHDQPWQDIDQQYQHYVDDLGYRDGYWKEVSDREHYGVWCTCFLAFNMRSTVVHTFLERWQQHTRNFTTQDQLSFPMVAQELGIHPYSLPDGHIEGNFPFNTLFVKLPHGL